MRDTLNAPNLNNVDPAAAVIAFAAWLTCRSTPVTFGSGHDAAPAAELAEAFRISQGYSIPEEGWDRRLLPYPAESQLRPESEKRELSVFLIDDGEQHHYVANSGWDALRSHVQDHGADCLAHPNEGVTVSLCGPDQALTIGFEGGTSDSEWPESAKVEESNGYWKILATASCAEWARHTGRGTMAPVQISSSVK